MKHWKYWVFDNKLKAWSTVGLLILITLPLTLILVNRAQDLRSSAASPDKLEVESGVLSGTVERLSDSLASGGQYIKFATSGTNPPDPTSPPSTGGDLYGPALGSDSLNNTRLGDAEGYKDDIRFRADHTGTFDSFRVYIIWSYSRPGYHLGDGGTIKFELRTDDGTSEHKPSNNVIATVIHDNPLDKGFFPLINFSPAPTLQKGQLYHLVATNIHPDPVNNFVSLDHIFVFNATDSMQPKYSDLDWAEMQAWDGGDWRVRRENTPILAIYYGDGHIQGMGYMEIWVGAPRPASGVQSFRERFIVTSGTRSISELNIRLRRVSGSDPLNYKLQTQSGTIIQQGTIPASSVTTSSNPEWVRTTFGSKQLIDGQSYYLVFNAPTSSVYEAYPIRSGGSYNFPPETYFSDGYAEYTSDGKTWYGWEQWGVNNRKEQDLQFYFK